MATSIRSIRSLAPSRPRPDSARQGRDQDRSGIFLPESSVKELNEGKVLAVGPGASTRMASVCPWASTLFGGSPVKVGDEEFHLFRDSDSRILAKINE
ncbi:conserved hypothetical protein [Verticillium alfalfae VaMs.102]|uniref:10 kDa heat shock protein n=1 Tax=Verticillium alfalfae (strain VaMs.102 / ATCC MYA-4576 / FGSC 10136) TaxID=526221 RepID=C9S7S3_VERA1|nr:conserved hypothetical protein [Verticillium alfalfae VaMs.102]EEY14808.1 conserved hypothetical protein [Verticillium alfalfae VaMs.102]